MQQDSQLWSMLLWSTDGTPQIQLQHPNYNLQIKQANTDETIPINYKPLSNPHETLGHYKAPAGTSQAQANVLTTKDEKYACKATKSSLT
eukprot:1987227-Ditylum_brightwellii.AAC.1